MAQNNNDFAILQPGSNLWGQTFMKRYQGTSMQGEYTYTSDLKKMQGGSEYKTEYFGYFHISNAHYQSEDRAVWDKMHINGSNFGRDVLHCIHSESFNPWSVMERHPYVEGEQDIYLIYACGPEFMLTATNLKLEWAYYSATESRASVEGRFQQVYNEPLVLTGDAATGYQKRKIGTFNLQPGGQQGENNFIAFRLTIEAQIDNANGERPMMRDFFLEGFSIHKQGGGLVRKEPKQCIIF